MGLALRLWHRYTSCFATAVQNGCLAPFLYEDLAAVERDSGSMSVGVFDQRPAEHRVV